MRTAVPSETTLDPVVPLFHEQAYAAIVDAAGESDLLVQRMIDRYGHCTFSPAEQLTAFADLVNWVEKGPGLSFRGHGLAYTEPVFSSAQFSESGGMTITMISRFH